MKQKRPVTNIQRLVKLHIVSFIITIAFMKMNTRDTRTSRTLSVYILGLAVDVFVFVVRWSFLFKWLVLLLHVCGLCAYQGNRNLPRLGKEGWFVSTTMHNGLVELAQ